MTPKPIAADAELVWTDLCDALRLCVAEAGCEPSPSTPLLVAFSGGVDSTAMLYCAAKLWPGAVHAVHVHHGLQTAADRFEVHCLDVCAKWNTPFTVQKLALKIQHGDSVEEAARDGRYLALVDAAKTQAASAVLLAQHANDQLETLLLALSRGAGVGGLAGMPVKKDWQGQMFLRPWLSISGKAIRQLVQDFELPFVEDPSNSDLRFTRNRIRQKLLPQLLEVFPSLLSTASRSARHCAQAAAMLDEQARLELQGQCPPNLAWLRSLTSEKLANVLRYWLRTEAGRAPSTKQLEQLMAQIQRASTRGHRLDVPVAGGRVRREGSVLRYIHRSGSKSQELGSS